MTAKRWQVLKSRRDLAHRTARERKKAGELQHLRETPERLKGMTRPERRTPKVEVSAPASQEVKETPKMGKKP